jgi:hypothetical protein
MAKNKVKRLVVLEQEGSMAGVLSVTDISRKLAKILTDEYKRYGHVKALLGLWKNNIKKKFWYRSAALPSRWGTSSSKRRSRASAARPSPAVSRSWKREAESDGDLTEEEYYAHILSMGKKTI